MKESSGTDVAVSIDTEFLVDMKVRAGVESNRDLVLEALSIYKWIIEEAESGQLIMSCDSEGGNTSRLAARVWEYAYKRNHSALSVGGDAE